MHGTVNAISDPMKRITEFVDWLVVLVSLALFLALEGAFLFGLYKLLSAL